MELDDWVGALATRLDTDFPVEVATVLDLARDAAHSVARPAAPLTAFVVGYAAALRGGGAEPTAKVIAQARQLALEWGEADAETRAD